MSKWKITVELLKPIKMRLFHLPITNIIPSTDFGKASNKANADFPRNIAIIILQIPKKTTEAPCLAPRRCCPASPPAP